MVYRPAQVYNGSGWDDVGDKRMLTHNHSGGADGANIPQSSVTNLTSDLASKLDLAGGKILQTIQTVKDDVFTTSSATYVDVTGLTVSITPTSATSKVLVFLSIGVFGNTASGYATIIRLLRSSTFINEPATGNKKGTLQTYTSSSDHSSPGTMILLDNPNTTSATTYKAQIVNGTAGGTAVLNRLAADANFTTMSSITVMEVSA